MPSLGQGETARPHGQEGAPEPSKSGGVGDPITFSDESGDGPCSIDAPAMDKGVETPPVGGRTPWPIGLHSIEEKKKKEDEVEQRKEEELRRLGAAAASARGTGAAAAGAGATTAAAAARGAATGEATAGGAAAGEAKARAGAQVRLEEQLEQCR